MTAPEPDGIVWHASSYCRPQGDCVEVARRPERVLVRDSQDPEGTALAVRTPAWRALLSALTH